MHVDNTLRMGAFRSMTRSRKFQNRTIDFLICSAAVQTTDGVDLNVGDEAISESLADGLRSRLGPDVSILRSINVRRSGREPDANRIGTDWISLLRGMRRTKFIVLGGGTLIQNDRGLAFYCVKVAAASWVTRTPLCISAIGVERVPTYLRLFFWAAMKRAASVTVRDEGSERLIREWSRIPLRVAADPLFLDPSGRQYDAENRHEVALSLRADAGADFVSNLARALKILGVKHALAVATDRRLEADESQLRELFSQAELEWMEVPRDATWPEVVTEISGSQLCVAMRLHACIFAVISATPTVVVTSENKTSALASELGLTQISRTADSDEIAQALQSATVVDRDALALYSSRAEIAIDEIVSAAKRG